MNDAGGVGPRPVGEALEGLARELGLGNLELLGRVTANWTAAVGAEVAAHTEPLRVEGRTLVVRALEPAWATQVRYLGAELARRLNAVVGVDAIDAVRVVVGRPARGRGGG